MRATREFQERIGRIDELVQKLESESGPDLRQTAKSLLESLMEIHGAGLERILEIVTNERETGAALVQALARDELIGNLLVLYGLHPDSFEDRAHRALDKVRARFRSHPPQVDVIAIGAGTVHVKIVGGGPSGLEEALREALLETAPDAVSVVIDGGPGSGFVPLSTLLATNGSHASSSASEVAQP